MLLRNGKLGLIDFGQVKRLGIPERLAYAKVCLYLAHSTAAKPSLQLIIALANADSVEDARVAEAYAGLGVRTMVRICGLTSSLPGVDSCGCFASH